MKTIPILVLVCFFTILMWNGTEALANDSKFGGYKSCTSACHKKDKEGNQKKVWLESKHSQAYKTLGTQKAKDKAKELSVSGNPQEAENCLVCHTTGFGDPASRFGEKFKVSDGVQCEACHGAGEKYRKKKIMKKIAEERGPDRKGVSATATELGLIFPKKEDCQRCHVPEINWKGKTFKNPSYKKFDFDTYFKKIEHRRPS